MTCQLFPSWLPKSGLVRQVVRDQRIATEYKLANVWIKWCYISSSIYISIETENNELTLQRREMIHKRAVKELSFWKSQMFSSYKIVETFVKEQ